MEADRRAFMKRRSNELNINLRVMGTMEGFLTGSSMKRLIFWKIAPTFVWSVN